MCAIDTLCPVCCLLGTYVIASPGCQVLGAQHSMLVRYFSTLAPYIPGIIQYCSVREV